MAKTADYLNALIRDRNSFTNEVQKVTGETLVSNLTFTELNNELKTDIYTDFANRYQGFTFAGCTQNGLPFVKDVCNILRPTNMSYMFSYYQDTDLDLSDIDVSNVVNMAQIFSGSETLNNINIAGWNTSNVTNMAYMFYTYKGDNMKFAESFSTNNVTSMFGMFDAMYNLTNINLSKYNVGNLEEAQYMFAYCTNLVDVDFTNWKPNKLTYVGFMFQRCNNLSTSSVKNICNMLLNANVYTKSMSNTNTSSPFYGSNIQINETTVGSDIYSALSSAGWSF